MYKKHYDWLKSQLNNEIFLKPFNEKKIIPSDLLNRASVIISRRDLTDSELSQADSLKLLQVPIAGYEKFNLERLNNNGVCISNNGGTNALSVAEHTIMLILTANRRFPWHYNNVVKGPWKNRKYENRELSGSIVGILGFGNCGKAVADILKGFKTTTIYHDIRSFKKSEDKYYNTTPVCFRDLIEESDYLSIHLPLTDKTRSIIGEKEFNLMKKDAVLINTSRGGVVDENSLVNALRRKQIRAAGLDVFSEEPLPEKSPIKKADNIVLTPHCAPSYESMLRLRTLLKDNINNIYNGLEPIFQVKSYEE